MKFTELVDYLSVADVFTDYILQYCTVTLLLFILNICVELLAYLLTCCGGRLTMNVYFRMLSSASCFVML